MFLLLLWPHEKCIAHFCALAYTHTIAFSAHQHQCAIRAAHQHHRRGIQIFKPCIINDNFLVSLSARHLFASFYAIARFKFIFKFGI